MGIMTEERMDLRKLLTNRTRNQSEIKRRMQEYLITYIKCVNQSSLRELLWLIVHKDHLPDDMKDNTEEIRDLAYGRMPKRDYKIK